MNELTPEMMAQAHMLDGKRRTPTKAELKQMQRGNIFAALTHIAGTTASTLIEAGVTPAIATGRSLIIAKEMLSYAEKALEEEEWEIAQLRQLRNQMAAQLIYSALRANPGLDNIKAIEQGYESATQIVKGAEKNAEEMCD